LKDITGSQYNVASQNKVFSLELAPEFLNIYRNYANWLKTLTERLGHERTIRVWQNAYCNYDETKLDEILSRGWIKKNDNELNNEDKKINDIIESCFSSPVEGLTKDEARQIIEATPPVKQIRKNFSSLNFWKDVTAYESLHISNHGRALLVESLIKHYKKQGELIAYDFIRERRIKGAEKKPLSMEELISAISTITKSEKPNLMTSALNVDVISSSDKEIVVHVKECEWARYFKENHPDVGYLMSCSTDEAAYKMANNYIRMQRTDTIMEGGEICDFRVYAVF
jgi:hypothetical protein